MDHGRSGLSGRPRRAPGDYYYRFVFEVVASPDLTPVTVLPDHYYGPVATGFRSARAALDEAQARHLENVAIVVPRLVARPNAPFIRPYEHAPLVGHADLAVQRQFVEPGAASERTSNGMVVEWQRDVTSGRRSCAHEVGHMLGLRNASEPTDLMGHNATYALASSRHVTAEDQRILHAAVESRVPGLEMPARLQTHASARVPRCALEGHVVIPRVLAVGLVAGLLWMGCSEPPPPPPRQWKIATPSAVEPDYIPCEDLPDPLPQRFCVHDDAALFGRLYRICGQQSPNVTEGAFELMAVLSARVAADLAGQEGWREDRLEVMVDSFAELVVELNYCVSGKTRYFTRIVGPTIFDIDPGMPIRVRVVAARGVHYRHGVQDRWDGNVGQWPCEPLEAPEPLRDYPGCDHPLVEDGRSCVHVDHLTWRVGQPVEVCPGLVLDSSDLEPLPDELRPLVLRCGHQYRRGRDPELIPGSEVVVSANVCVPTDRDRWPDWRIDVRPERVDFRYWLGSQGRQRTGRVRGGQVTTPTSEELQRIETWEPAR